MGCLFSRGRSSEILIVGLDQAGKTQTLYWLKYREKMTTTPTVGFNVETVEHKGMLMTFWDLAGQQKVRSLWSQHYSSVDALWFVVDSFDQERIAQAKQELWAILNDKKLRKDAMLLVLANKQDLNGALSPDQLQKELDLSTIVDRPWYIIGCCAQSGDGISSALDWIYFQMENKSKSS